MTTSSRSFAAALGLAALALTAGCAGQTPGAGSTPPASTSVSTPGASSSAPAGSATPGASPSASPDDDSASPSAPGSGSPSPSGSASPSASPSGSASSPLLRAAESALVAVPGGRVSSIESERGGQSWEVHVLTEDGAERQLRLSGDGSEVTSDTAENTDDDDRTENQVLYGAEVDHVAAAEAVLAEEPGGVISELELDEDDDGALTWEAGVETGAERRDVTVDAASGEVLDNDLDD
ncbi:PepSY domain-containing protein [Auraticoccus monumenti]|uniref:Peptidase propeptide and YPEB domain-containing protein n=1 Tax=Auraticoccus monumenti TaxID=675864 RepID=A0A1G7AR53_9ACTN|nr:PepSY domain-containing protein [Auraticoccus monumenti]SDE17271.1 Peptidase propeptide and YPEB domain-containing protein [Auraticoccus monumenti]